MEETRTSFSGNIRLIKIISRSRATGMVHRWKLLEFFLENPVPPAGNEKLVDPNVFIQPISFLPYRLLFSFFYGRGGNGRRIFIFFFFSLHLTFNVKFIFNYTERACGSAKRTVIIRMKRVLGLNGEEAGRGCSFNSSPSSSIIPKAAKEFWKEFFSTNPSLSFFQANRRDWSRRRGWRTRHRPPFTPTQPAVTGRTTAKCHLLHEHRARTSRVSCSRMSQAVTSTYGDYVYSARTLQTFLIPVNPSVPSPFLRPFYRPRSWIRAKISSSRDSWVTPRIERFSEKTFPRKFLTIVLFPFKLSIRRGRRGANGTWNRFQFVHQSFKFLPLLFFFFSLLGRKWIKVEGYFDFRFGKAILCKFDDINWFNHNSIIDEP